MTVTHQTTPDPDRKPRKQRTAPDLVRAAVDAIKRLGPDALASTGQALAKEAPMSARILSEAISGQKV